MARFYSTQNKQEKARRRMITWKYSTALEEGASNFNGILLKVILENKLHMRQRPRLSRFQFFQWFCILFEL